MNFPSFSAQIMPTATPMAASTPAAETLKVAIAPFSLVVPVTEELLPVFETVLEAETVPLVEEARPSVVVSDAEGYSEP